MGFYSGLRIDCRLYDEWVPVISMLMSVRRVGDAEPWKTVAAQFPQYPQLRAWAGVYRCSFIPFGYACVAGWDLCKDWEPTLDGNRWRFQCALKNYEGEIEAFLAEVLRPMVAQMIEAQYINEAMDEAVRYPSAQVTHTLGVHSLIQQLGH